MAFTTVPFAGLQVVNGNDFGWCSVSPTKAFLIYTAWTGATLGTGIRKLIIQAVYFNGKNAATFGPACSVGIIPGGYSIMPQITSLTDGRLFVSMRDNGSQWSYSVYNVEAGDLVSLSYKHGTLYLQLGSLAAIAVEALTNNKVLATNTNDSANRFQVITVGDTALTFANVAGSTTLTAYPFNNAQGSATASQLSGHSIKRDRSGNILVCRSFLGPLVGGTPTNGVQMVMFDPNGVVLNYGMLLSDRVGGIDGTGVQKGKDILPISANTALSLGAKSAATTAYGSVGGENSFTRLTLDTAAGMAASPSAHISYRDITPCMFADVIWLDDDYFFALACLGTAYVTIGDRTPAQWSASTIQATPQVAYIGKYNKDSNSIVMSDSMPLALPDATFNGTSQTKFLHRISNTEVAIIQPTVKDGANGTQNYEIAVTVIGA